MLAALLSRRARAFLLTGVAVPLARWGWNRLQSSRRGRPAPRSLPTRRRRRH